MSLTPIRMIKITLYAAYDESGEVLAPDYCSLAEGFAEQLRDSGALEVFSDFDEVEKTFDPEPDDAISDAVVAQWPESQIGPTQ